MFERPDEPPMLPRTAAPSTTDLTVVDLDEVVRPRVSVRRRAAQVSIVLAVAVVVVGLLLHSVGPFQQGTASLLPSPTPTPATVVIESNVTFGTLTVNGQPLTGAPPRVTRLFHVGTNVVTLAAPPFHPHTCHILLPSTQHSDELGCRSSRPVGSSVEVHGVSVVPDFLVDLELGSTDLPPDLAASALAAALQAVAAIRPQTVVPAGQYYATGQDAHGYITARRATVPLPAELRVDLVSCGASQFCPSPLDPRLVVASDQHIWSVGLDPIAGWRFTLPQGQPAVLSPTVAIGGLPLQLLLADDGAGGWSVVSLISGLVPGQEGTVSLEEQLTAALCQVGISLLEGQMQAQLSSGYSPTAPYQRGVEGCMIQLLNATGSTVLGTFLWRFGVVLAVDAGAHALAPWLPIAPQAEVAAVEG
jgi:hypothetical protein